MQFENSARNIGLNQKPNMFAGASAFEASMTDATFHGYQSFRLSYSDGKISAISDNLSVKFNLLKDFFIPKFFARRTVLDLGGNNGFYSFAALKAGALEADVVDLDEDPINNLREFKEIHPGFRITGHLQKANEWQKPADIVFAFALIHWVFNLTEETNNKLEKPIKHLAKLTHDALFVEWVDQSDEVIKNYDHIGINSGLAHDYSEEKFVTLLKSEFAHVRLIGSVSNTRRLYLCHHESFNLDLSWTEPLLFPKSTLISSRLLCTLDDNPIWSRVYKLEDKFVKQVTKAFGVREYEALKIPLHAGIPIASELKLGESAASFSLQTMPGLNLEQVCKTSNLTTDEITNIACQLMEIICTLEARGLIHRDIHPGNILYCPRTRRVSLIDFGWAASFGENAPTPEGLGFWWGFDGRAPEPERNDVYSWGCLILWLLGGINSYIRIPAAWAVAKSVYIRPKAEELLSILVNLASDEGLLISDMRLRRLVEELAAFPLKNEKLENEQRLMKLTIDTLQRETQQARAETQQARAETQQARAETQQALNELSVSRAELDDLKIRLTEATKSNHQLASNLAQIHSSRSWKFTSPLRFIVARLRLLFKS